MSQLIPKVKSGDWQSVVLFADVITKAVAPTSNFITNDFILNGSIVITGLTTSRLIMTNASKELVSLAAITAPLDLTGTTLSHLTTAGYIHLPAAGTANQILKNSGVAGTGAWGTVTENSGALAAISTISMSGQLTNTLAIGTSPLAVTSTTVNTNLNADLLDGQHASAFLTAEADTLATVVARGANAGATINVGVGNTLTLATGSITDSSGAISFGSNNLSTTGYVGFGTTAGSSANTVNINYVSALASLTSLNLTAKVSKNASVTYVYGLGFNSAWQPVSTQVAARSASSVRGLFGIAGLDTTYHTSSGNTTIAECSGVYGGIYIIKGGSHSGSAIITLGAAFNAQNPSIIGIGTITTNYAFYDQGQTAGTTNWGLGINTANNYIAGSLSIGKVTAPTVPLDVVGAILNTTTIEAGTGFRCGGTAAVADGTYVLGLGGTTNGTITVKGGIITAVQQVV